MNNKQLKYLFISLFFVFAFLFTKWYILNESPLYRCDLCDQNLNWHDFYVLLKENISEFWKNLSHDIYTMNRNASSVILLLPFAFLIKDFRFGFVFASELVYMIPSMILIWYLFDKHFLKNAELKVSVLLMILSSIFLAVNLWHPVLSGILDICGMVPVLICFILYFKYGFNKRMPVPAVIAASLLIYTAFLFRRWYSVVIFSFFASVIIENIIVSFKAQDKIKQLLYTFFHLGIFSGISAILAYYIQGGYFRNIINSEIAERSSYIVNYNQIEAIITHNWGIAVFSVIVLGFILCFKNHLVRFCALNIFIYVFMFIAVMNNRFLWINHFIYPACCALILFCAGAYKISEFIKNEKLKNVFAVLIILFNIYNFCTFFVIDKPAKLMRTLPYTTAYPEKNPDFDEILDLYNYLENEYNKNNSIKIAMYGLNNSVGWWQFRCLNPDSSFVKEAAGFERIIDADFENETYDEDFIIFFDPSIIFAPDDQSTKIREVSRMFKTNTGFARNYEKAEEIELQDETETKVIVYKRKSNE